MNGQTLKETAIRIFGERGWQTRLAEFLDRDVSTVRRWTSGQIPVPGPVERAVEGLEKKTG